MRHGTNWEYHVLGEFLSARESEIRTAEGARSAEAAFRARLPPGAGMAGVTSTHLRADPALHAAREAFRAADRARAAARDEAAGFECDLEGVRVEVR